MAPPKISAPSVPSVPKTSAPPAIGWKHSDVPNAAGKPAVGGPDVPNKPLAIEGPNVPSTKSKWGNRAKYGYGDSKYVDIPKVKGRYLEKYSTAF